MEQIEQTPQLNKLQLLAGAVFGLNGIREMFENLEKVKTENEHQTTQNVAHEITKIKDILGIKLFAVARLCRKIYPAVKFVEPVFKSKSKPTK